MLYIFLSLLAFFILGLPYSILLLSKHINNRRSILEIFILTPVIGPLIINYLIFALGYTGLLSRENMFIAILVIIFVPLLSKRARSSLAEFYFVARGQLYSIKNVFGKLTLVEAFPLSLMATILIITSYHAFTKAPVLRDPYAVWLFYGKKIMETRTIPLYYGNAPDISWSGNYPPLISFLAGYYFISLGQAIPEAFTHVSWLYGGLILLVTFMLAKELGLGKFALASAFLLTTAPMFTLELVNFGYVTIAWAFYITVACFYLVRLLNDKTMYALLAFGLSLGAALLSTYLSLIFVASLLILSLLYLLRTGQSFLVGSRALIVGLIISFGLALPWFIRNSVLLQNPIYPWLYELFGGKGLNLALMRLVPQPKYNMLNLVIDNTFRTLPNDDIGYTLLILGPMGSIYLIRRKKETLAPIGWVTLIFFMLLLSAMSVYYGYERYLLLVGPLLAVSAGFLLNKIFSINRIILKMLILVSIVVFSLPSYLYLISLMPSGAPIGETEPLSYIEKYIDDYLPFNATILTNEIQLYFINRKTINVYNLQEIFQAENLTELIHSLKFHNITHILINANIDANVLDKTPLMQALAGYDETFKTLLNMFPYKLYKVNYGGKFS